MPRNPRWPERYDTPPAVPLVTPPSQQDKPFDPNLRAAPPKRKRGSNSELAELRARARSAGAAARTTVSIQVRASVELYKALVELAEEYHQPISQVARQCLEDGTRKYREFSTPGLNPFGKPSLARTNTSLATRMPPSIVSRVRAKEVTEEDFAVAGIEQYAEALSKLPPGLLIPSAPPIHQTHPHQEETSEEVQDDDEADQAQHDPV